MLPKQVVIVEIQQLLLLKSKGESNRSREKLLGIRRMDGLSGPYRPLQNRKKHCKVTAIPADTDPLL